MIKLRPIPGKNPEAPFAAHIFLDGRPIGAIWTCSFSPACSWALWASAVIDGAHGTVCGGTTPSRIAAARNVLRTYRNHRSVLERTVA